MIQGKKQRQEFPLFRRRLIAMLKEIPSENYPQVWAEIKSITARAEQSDEVVPRLTVVKDRFTARVKKCVREYFSPKT